METLTEIDIDLQHEQEVVQSAIELANCSRDLKILLEDTQTLARIQGFDIKRSADATAQASENMNVGMKRLQKIDNAHEGVSLSLVFALVGVLTLGPLGGLLAGTLGVFAGIGSGTLIGVLHHTIHPDNKLKNC